jgi:hypothetical protein
MSFLRTRASVVRTSVVAAVLALAGSLMATSPAEAANRVTPGNFTGYGFDQCLAPSQEAMDAWLTASPYWAVGIYIAGDSRYCKDQPNLTPEWVSTQLRNGWRLLPLTVGRQASCSGVERYKNNRISADPTGNYATAREQGRIEASTTVRAARALGIAAQSTLWYDIEAFDITGTRCRESALAFLSAWTGRLHRLGYQSGVYSSAASGIKALDDAQAQEPGRFTMPDAVWIADWNGRADIHSDYVRPESWMPHKRIHQYRGGHDETYGGVTINIDSNYMSLGRGSVAPKASSTCGVRVDFPVYRRVVAGRTGEQVRALQCLLRQKRLYDGRLHGRYTPKVARAVKTFQRTREFRVTGNVSAGTWAALLSEGRSPLVKIGSAGQAVRRAQRALNAAARTRLTVTGVFDDATTAAVRTYQRQRDMYPTGVLASDTWAELKRGRR